MATTSHIRGVLLEEAVLFLLEAAGFRSVAFAPEDRTIRSGPAGLEVRGRGASHQIDALAEFRFATPFVYRQRLLVEGKCLAAKTDLPVVRNSVGVWKDVSEFWRGEDSGSIGTRFHYLPAIFSVSSFTEPAQRYAFAQDVFLFPLSESPFLAPLVAALWELTGHRFGSPSGRGIEIDLTAFRLSVRRQVRSNDAGLVDGQWDISDYLAAVRSVGAATIGMAGGAFPLFLVPRDPNVLQDLPSGIDMRIRRRADDWFIEADGRFLFSFGLPQSLFRLYAREGRLNQEAALRIKREHMHTLDVVIANGDSGRIVQFRLDREWIDELAGENAAKMIDTP